MVFIFLSFVGHRGHIEQVQFSLSPVLNQAWVDFPSYLETLEGAQSLRTSYQIWHISCLSPNWVTSVQRTRWTAALLSKTKELLTNTEGEEWSGGPLERVLVVYEDTSVERVEAQGLGQSARVFYRNYREARCWKRWLMWTKLKYGSVQTCIKRDWILIYWWFRLIVYVKWQSETFDLGSLSI